MSIVVSAPSNIALIKYMGKTNAISNHPSNASLSYTLEHLRTYVQLSPTKDFSDRWEILSSSHLDGKTTDLMPMDLSEKGQRRFLNHFTNLKLHWGISGNFIIRSANNFPSDCGLASSASSFAALTLAAAEIVKNRGTSGLSSLSRQGSGSSCRSFYSPWALWKKEFAEPIDCGYEKLHHMVIVVENKKKSVSSSEAHLRVVTSSLFEGRQSRAHMRLEQMVNSLREKNWKKACILAWDEFMDMHELFHTSEPSFSYLTEDSNAIINELKVLLTSEENPPLVTMDAGPNVHLLLNENQSELFQILKNQFSKKYRVIHS